MQLFCILLLLYISVTQSTIYDNFEKAFRNRDDSNQDTNEINREELNESNQNEKIPSLLNFHQPSTDNDVLQAQIKAKVLKKAKEHENKLNHDRFIPLSKPNVHPFLKKEYYHMDPVLNHLSRRSFNPLINIHAKTRRQKNDDDKDTSFSSSTSLEMKHWKDEFNDIFMQKKFEAINSTNLRGDEPNMAAANPSGVLCGDPQQHDMPWGNCMMPAECDAEYRVYRGDHFCGRTQYVCCAIEITNYDLYQGFDVSFEGTSFSKDSSEKREIVIGSSFGKKKRKLHLKKRRGKERRRRKRKIKKSIKSIIREMKKILHKTYRNSTRHRKHRTKILKKYIKSLKDQYKKDRKSVKDIHTADIDQIDTLLENKLEQIRELNKNFLMNGTFRDMIINKTITRTGARMLAEAYPELTEYLPAKWLRRAGGGEVDVNEVNEEGTDAVSKWDTNVVSKGGTDAVSKWGNNVVTKRGANDYLEYDIEYGTLFY